MNARVNDSKFQLASAVLVDALADPTKTRTEILAAVWPTLNTLAEAGDYAGADTLWCRLRGGLNSMSAPA